MSDKIHELRIEIKTINEMLDSLTGTMHQLALEELKNLQFELDMLLKTTSTHDPAYEYHEKGVSDFT